MNEASSHSGTPNAFSPRFNFDRSPPHFGATPDHNGAFSFSPHNFDRRSPILALNFNSSPKDLRLEKASSVSSDDPFHLGFSPPDSDRKFKPRLNPAVVLKKTEKENDKNVTPQLRPGGQIIPETKPPAEPELFDSDEFLKSNIFVAESTVLESNLKSEKAPMDEGFNRFAENSLFFSDSEDEEPRPAKKAGPWKPASDLPIRRLAKMDPLFIYFTRLYNDKNNKPVFDCQNRYELLIVRAILKHLGQKNTEALPLEPVMLGMALETAWKTPTRNRNVVGLIIRMAVTVLRQRFGVLNDLNCLPKNELKERFRKHYFGCISERFPGILDMDLELQRNATKLNKDQMSMLVKAPAFAGDFNKFVKEELSRYLNAYRSRKLLRIFLRVEEIFLSSKSEAEALDQVVKWIGSPKFRWVLHNSSYVQGLEQVRRK